MQKVFARNSFINTMIKCVFMTFDQVVCMFKCRTIFGLEFSTQRTVLVASVK